MNSLFDGFQQLVEALKVFAYFIPLFWVSFIIPEWYTRYTYYKRFHIEHSFKIDYKIVFNPKYLLSLLLSVLIISVIYSLMQTNRWEICVLGFVILVVASLWYAFVSNTLHKNMIELSEYKTDIKKSYRDCFQKWLYNRNKMNAYIVLLALWVISVPFSYKDFSDFLFANISYEISENLSFIGGYRPIACLFWFLLSSCMTHMLLNIFTNLRLSSDDYLENLRLIIVGGKTYAILAPDSDDNNGTCIAVRTIICKKENGLIFGYLIQDETFSQSAPYHGISFLIDVDKIESLYPSTHRSALLSDYELREYLVNDNMIEYLRCDKSWSPIRSFSTPKVAE